MSDKSLKQKAFSLRLIVLLFLPFLLTGLIGGKSLASSGKERTGAELYTMRCGQCHVERYPTERTGAQWKTIMLHMRTRASLTGEDAKKILKYLQESK